MVAWVAGWLTDNNATWPILQAKTCQTFSIAEIPRWAKCGKKNVVQLFLMNLGQGPAQTPPLVGEVIRKLTQLS